MGLSKKGKKRFKEKPLIINEEKLSLFNAIVEEVGGLKEFEKAMDFWQFKGQKAIVEDVVSPEELAKMYSYDEHGNVYLKKNSGNKKAGYKVGYMGSDLCYLITKVTFGDYIFGTSLNKIVFCLHNGRWAKKGYDVDHINGIKTDNRPCNLREGTRSENSGNTKLSKSNKTGAKGVCFARLRIRSQSRKRASDHYFVYCVIAHVEKDGKSYERRFPRFKEFSDEILIQKAKAWRDEKSKELFGEFHRSN